MNLRTSYRIMCVLLVKDYCLKIFSMRLKDTEYLGTLYIFKILRDSVYPKRTMYEYVIYESR